MKEKEIWMQKLKEKLDDYAEPIPTSSWERLEKELSPPAEKRIIPHQRRWMTVAAAVLLAVVSSVSLYFIQSPAADEIRDTVATVATPPDAMPKQQEPILQQAGVEPMGATAATHQLIAKSTSPTKTLLAVDLRNAEDRKLDIATTLEESVTQEEKEGQQQENIIESSEDGGKTASKATEEPKKREARRPSSKDKLHLPEQAKTTKDGRWTVGASVGNAGALSTGNDYAENSPVLRVQMDITSSPNGVIKVPEGQTVVFKDGVPYLLDTKRITDITHRQPISFGLSVRKDLKNGFSIETGAMYTLLSSDVRMGGDAQVQSQKLHYVGIPIRANWNFIQKKRVTFYLSGGGAVEKCVYGELAGEKQTVNPVQFSLSGAVGAQINVTNRVGFYIEPGVSYFFNDGTSLQTIRKETPFNFNLQAGIRFTY